MSALTDGDAGVAAGVAAAAGAGAPSLRRVRAWLCDLLHAARGESLALLLLALGCEVLTLAARSLLIYVSCGALLLLSGWHGGSWQRELALLAPIAWPALALLAPFPSGWWWRQRQGGREPSQREREAYEDSLATLHADAGGDLRPPAAWFVLDLPGLEAAVCADTLMLSRGLLESEHLTAVLAHELGHLAMGDGRLTAAINRLLILRRPRAGGAEAERAPARQRAPMPLGQALLSETTLLVASLAWRACVLTLRLARGGLGLRLCARPLGDHWQSRELEADAYAAEIGQGEQLADFLEAHALIHDEPAPWSWLEANTHPPTELRIDRLRGAVAGERS
jgi:Zn-dependent protease with chaperone function